MYELAKNGIGIKPNTSTSLSAQILFFFCACNLASDIEIQGIPQNKKSVLVLTHSFLLLACPFSHGLLE